jgi:hypothetical protein
MKHILRVLLLLALEAAVSSAAGAASVAGDPLSLIYDGLLAINMPGWFSSAIPSDMATQIAALESNINALRVTSTDGSVTVAIITTTDSEGRTLTTSSISTLSILSITNTSGVTATTYVSLYSMPMPNNLTQNRTTTAGLGAGFSTLTTEVINGATSVFSVAVSGASSVASKASSVVGGASSALKSASGAERTQVSGCAASVIGLLGLMAAL